MTIRLGLVAASRIAEPAVVDPAREVAGIEVVAVAARDGSRAREAATRWGLDGSHGSYEDLLAEDDIDAVYIGTPASLHRRWTLAAIEAGKHVLVEKPLAANGDDARTMARAARGSGLVVMEAFHPRYHPLFAQMRGILDSGILGELERAEAAFELAAERIPRSDIRWDLALGGGALMDLGVYPLTWLVWAMGGVPQVVSAHADCPVPEVDGRFEVELAWPRGTRGDATASMIEAPGVVRRSLVLQGDRGTMLVENPLAPQYGGSRILVEVGGTRIEHPVSDSSTYVHQLEAFRDAIELGAGFPTTMDAGAGIMDLIDECYIAAGMAPRPTYPD